MAGAEGAATRNGAPVPDIYLDATAPSAPLARNSGVFLSPYSATRPHGSLARQTLTGRLQQLLVTNAVGNHI
jgi:hypothetical protein